MAFGTLRNAVADVAETLRRLFADPGTHRESLDICTPAGFCAELPETRPREVNPEPSARLVEDPGIQGALIQGGATEFPIKLVHEDAWPGWVQAARALHAEPLAQGRMSVLPVPRLPSQAVHQGIRPGGFSLRIRQEIPRLLPTPVHRHQVAISSPPSRSGLPMMAAMPLAFPGRPWAELSKPLQMRHALELVKATGENIRNVEVLGLFQIPTKGVLEMHHDSKQNRLLIRLDPKAREASRKPFLVARRKADGALVTCFLEQT